MKDLLAHLQKLVGCNTENPPREISADDEIFKYIAAELGDEFEVSLSDYGHGQVALFAIRGKPSILFNVHLDTVPAGPGWSSDPFKLSILEGRAYGRGACDIKGAAAALMQVAQTTNAPMAILFTTDEEGAQGCCVKQFLAANQHEWRQIVVAEPTGCQPVVSHRGYYSAQVIFTGVAAHSSEPGAASQSAIHKMVQWSTQALDLAGDLDCCFNLGLVAGGTAGNVIASNASVKFSMRSAPGESAKDLAGALQRAAQGYGGEVCTSFDGPSLPASLALIKDSERFLSRVGLPSAASVRFWTEASLFSEAGFPALVLGPGDIAQAHTADEFVAVDQLRLSAQIYTNMVNCDG